MRASRLLICVAFGFYIQASTAIAVDKTDERLQSLLKQEKSKLDQLKEKIERQEQKVSKVGEEEISFLKNLSQIEDRLKLKEKEMEVYKWDIQVNRNKVFTLTSDIKELEKLREKQKSILAKRLRMSYKEGSLFPIKVLFSADNVNDLLQRIKYLETVTAYDSSIFERYQEKLRALELERENLLQTQARLMELEQEAVNKKEEVRLEREGKASLLAKLKNEKKIALQARQELINATSSLNNLIMGLEKRLSSGEGLNFEEAKGVLPLPVQGAILNRIGKRKDSSYESYIVYNGINIKTPKGTPVRVIHEGKVLFSGPLEGYGNLIIVGHGEQFHSLYGHLDEIITAVGKKVRSGQIIAKSGDTGSLVGESLYFELRRMGKPIDPSGWFQMAKK